VEDSPVAKQFALAPWPTEPPYGYTKAPAAAKPRQGTVWAQYDLISKYSSNVNFALAFIKATLQPSVQYVDFTQGGDMPVTAAPYKEYKALQKYPWPLYRTQMGNMGSTPFNGSWGQLETVVGEAINKMGAQIATTGSYSPSSLEQALTEANAQLDATLRQQPNG
jgi:hypothetical protein